MKNHQSNRTHNTTNALRSAGPAALAEALVASRKTLFELFAAYRAALGDELRVPLSPELNLPRWELGHIGWFEEYWIGRNQHWAEGLSVDQGVIVKNRAQSRLANADRLYDSSHVAHASRWQLDLPDIARTESYLTQVRGDTLDKLHRLATKSDEPSDDALYFFRLALFHEAMHREAWVYVAQTLGIALGAALPTGTPLPLQDDDAQLVANGGLWQLGSADNGFAFDNELGAHQVSLANFEIDRSPVSWRRFLAFLEAGGYDEPRWWSEQGRAWLQRQPTRAPRYLRRTGNAWQRHRFGVWQDVNPDLPAMNLTFYEAQAWCNWAGRRLPSEAEWEMAACTDHASEFIWGQVWEWTATPFAPYPGFEPHPYRDYSAPWFDGRPVLRGASFATDPAMRHQRYRNFFTAERNDIFAGFRSCAL